MFVHAVKCTIADATPNQAVTCFHAIFHATAKVNEADSAALASSGRVFARYPESLSGTEIGVRFGVRFGLNDSQTIAARAVKNGASCQD